MRACVELSPRLWDQAIVWANCGAAMPPQGSRERGGGLGFAPGKEGAGWAAAASGLGCGMQGCFQSYPAASRAQQTLSPQPRGHSSRSFCKQRGSLPARGQAAKFQPRAHFSSMTPVGPQQETRDAGGEAPVPAVLCVDGSPSAVCPTSFLSQLGEGLAKSYKTSFFLSVRLCRVH